MQNRSWLCGATLKQQPHGVHLLTGIKFGIKIHKGIKYARVVPGVGPEASNTISMQKDLLLLAVQALAGARSCSSWHLQAQGDSVVPRKLTAPLSTFRLTPA